MSSGLLCIKITIIMEKRIFRGRRLKINLSLLLVSLCFFSVYGQDQSPEATEPGPPELALLIKGPVLTSGIPFLSPNGLAAYTGKYRMGDDEITVFFTREDIVIPENWKPRECSGADVLAFPFREGSGYLLRSNSNWVVFVYFEGPEEYHCLFLRTFYNRLNYFQQISDVFSFPAVLELQ